MNECETKQVKTEKKNWAKTKTSGSPLPPGKDKRKARNDQKSYLYHNQEMLSTMFTF